MEPVARASHKDFPCPECSEQVSIDRVRVLQVSSCADSTIKDPAFVEAIRRTMAHQIGNDAYEAGLVAFEQGEADSFAWTFPVTATLGVVSQATVATLEQRVADRQDEIAQNVVEEACALFRQWNGDQSKHLAIAELKLAAIRVQERRAARKRTEEER